MLNRGWGEGRIWLREGFREGFRDWVLVEKNTLGCALGGGVVELWIAGGAKKGFG